MLIVGSMSGSGIEQAKESITALVDKLLETAPALKYVTSSGKGRGSKVRIVESDSACACLYVMWSVRGETNALEMP